MMRVIGIGMEYAHCMNRPSKKEIKAAIEKLKEKNVEPGKAAEPNIGKPPAKKSSQRIRKQGV